MTEMTEEIVVASGTLEAAPLPSSPTLYGTTDAAEIVRQATDQANVLAKVIRDKALMVKIQGREHVLVEGWTLLGNFVGVYPVLVWTRPLEDGWEARVEARTLSGQVLGAAESMCLHNELSGRDGKTPWLMRPEYALRSMSQTRATSKALRMPLGAIMTLAGFDSTPADEMPDEERELRAEKGTITVAQQKALVNLLGTVDAVGIEAIERGYEIESPGDLSEVQAAAILTGGAS